MGTKPASKKLTKNFCNCIKKVRSYIKPIRGTQEQAAIAVCIKSVLHTKGKTLRKFKCRTGKLFTQKMKKK